MKNNLLRVLAQYGRMLQGRLWPRVREELGPLSEKLQQFVKVLGLAEVEAPIPRARGWVGRPLRDRAVTARAFVDSFACCPLEPCASFSSDSFAGCAASDCFSPEPGAGVRLAR